MHVARLVDLRHGRVHQRVAGAAFAPGLEQGGGLVALDPVDAVVLGFEGLHRRVWKVAQNLGIKISPDQLTEPGGCTLVSLLLRRQAQRGQVADGHRAKPQVNAQVTGSLHRREVTRVPVAADAWQKLGQQRITA